MVTLKDVAKKAGVSLASASRALHNNGYISKEAKERVKKAAESLGYIVNYNAVYLKDKKSKNVGIIITDIENPYFIDVVSDLKNKLQEYGYGLILAVSNNNKADESKQIKYLVGNKVSTLLFIPTNSNNHHLLEVAKNNGVNPIQLFINVYDDINSIVNNDELGAYLGGKQAVLEGYKRIALIDVKYDKSAFNLEVEPKRENGFKRLIKEYPDVKFKIIKSVAGDNFTKEVIDALDSFSPDAIIAGTGVFGLNALKYLKMNSLKTKLITFDDNNWFAFYGVTSIRQDETSLINEIVRLIIKNDTENVEHVKIDETLVVRN
ncbi:MAG: LacI family DNA-binding transcriptional regulator [Bacilli bacterium]|nr:LacI family DNA-binding transcriptional regulator [Bacilli bacterium]